MKFMDGTPLPPSGRSFGSSDKLPGPAGNGNGFHGSPSAAAAQTLASPTLSSAATRLDSDPSSADVASDVPSDPQFNQRFVADLEAKVDVKHFVLDTNVLLHNPNAIFLLQDNAIVIPFDVIEELDKFKTGNDDLARNARTVIRHLDRLRGSGSLADGVPVQELGAVARDDLPLEHPTTSGVHDNAADN